LIRRKLFEALYQIPEVPVFRDRENREIMTGIPSRLHDEEFLKAALYALAAFLVGGITTCLAFIAAIKWSPHTEPGVGKVCGVGFPSICVGMLAMIITFVIFLKKSASAP
jgi:hypothetical protein